MRIAVLAPIWENVPPPAYGGIELVAGLLADGLATLGHDVTLFATGRSTTRARLAYTQDIPLRELGLSWHDCQPREARHVAACFTRAGEFDVIHNHAGYLPLMLAPYVATPVLTTLHGPFDDHNRAFFQEHRELPYVSISQAQRDACPGLRYVRTIYHGIETDHFQTARKQGYLLYLARLSPEKGTHLAVEVARRLGKPLIIAGKIDPVDQAYFDGQIRPLIDGDQVRFIGEVGGEAKASVIAGADALLHPVQWPEPFGLALVEAMAAGTPVLAFPRGSIPELVEDGLTGFVVQTVDEMCQAVGRAAALDPDRCRAEAVRRFDVRRMVGEYVRAFEEVAGSPAYTGSASSSWSSKGFER